MITSQDLKNKLDSLVNNNRSGIVAICGSPADRDTLEYMLYFRSLGIVYIVHGDWGSEYFDASAAGILGRALKEFAYRQDYLSVADLDRNETAFLKDELGSLLWHMVHDEADIPDCEYASDAFYPIEGQAPATFTLFGGTDLESDIERFREAVVGNCQNSGHKNTVITKKDDDGKTYYCHRETLLCNYDWRNLYARVRQLTIEKSKS